MALMHTQEIVFIVYKCTFILADKENGMNITIAFGIYFEYFSI